MACLLLLGGLVAVGQRRRAPEAAAHSSAAGFTSADCRRCHEGVWREWDASYHSKAHSDTNVQAAFRQFGFDRKCQSCHAPEPILSAGLSAAPTLREQDVASGVNCLTCHRSADGLGVAAARDLPQAPCRPARTPELVSGESCGVCHVAIHKDWLESRYRAEGRTCQSCHMPAVAERPGGKSHVCLGGHDEALIRAGARMECRQERNELVVVVTNHATGHNFPGERHNRVLLVQVVERTPAGDVTLSEQALIKGITPFRGESSAERIRADQSFEARFQVVDPPVTADVRFLYRPFPWLTDHDSIVVHQAEMFLEGP